MNEAQVRVGRWLRSKWHLDSLLAIGGMAAVYAATHRNGARAAIKMLHAQYTRHDQARRRFLAEGYAANKVGHRNAVMVLDDDTTEDGEVYLVMELLDGESLEARLDRVGVMSPIEVLEVADQMLEVLACAHPKGILHRDIKPANIMLCRDGSVKLLDFGLARVRELSAESLDQSDGIVFGTVSYIAPEQARADNQNLDARSDMWSVAATMFRALTGETVFPATGPVVDRLLAVARKPARSIATVAPRLPKALVELIDRALAFDPDDRWPSANVMRVVVQDVLAQLIEEREAGVVAAAAEEDFEIETAVVFRKADDPHRPKTDPLALSIRPHRLPQPAPAPATPARPEPTPSEGPEIDLDTDALRQRPQEPNARGRTRTLLTKEGRAELRRILDARRESLGIPGGRGHDEDIPTSVAPAQVAPAKPAETKPEAPKPEAPKPASPTPVISSPFASAPRPEIPAKPSVAVDPTASGSFVGQDLLIDVEESIIEVTIHHTRAERPGPIAVPLAEQQGASAQPVSGDRSTSVGPAPTSRAPAEPVPGDRSAPAKGGPPRPPPTTGRAPAPPPTGRPGQPGPNEASTGEAGRGTGPTARSSEATRVTPRPGELGPGRGAARPGEASPGAVTSEATRVTPRPGELGPARGGARPGEASPGAVTSEATRATPRPGELGDATRGTARPADPASATSGDASPASDARTASPAVTRPGLPPMRPTGDANRGATPRPGTPPRTGASELTRLPPQSAVPVRDASSEPRRPTGDASDAGEEPRARGDEITRVGLPPAAPPRPPVTRRGDEITRVGPAPGEPRPIERTMLGVLAKAPADAARPGEQDAAAGDAAKSAERGAPASRPTAATPAGSTKIMPRTAPGRPGEAGAEAPARTTDPYGAERPDEGQGPASTARTLVAGPGGVRATTPRPTSGHPTSEARPSGNPVSESARPSGNPVSGTPASEVRPASGVPAGQATRTTSGPMSGSTRTDGAASGRAAEGVRTSGPHAGASSGAVADAPARPANASDATGPENGEVVARPASVSGPQPGAGDGPEEPRRVGAVLSRPAPTKSVFSPYPSLAGAPRSGPYPAVGGSAKPTGEPSPVPKDSSEEPVPKDSSAAPEGEPRSSRAPVDPKTRTGASPVLPFNFLRGEAKPGEAKPGDAPSGDPEAPPRKKS
jgi:serine/threonine-protein kinase